ncbi:MAG: hypothetical protein NC548_33610 [Lachnospiraceae bacterium]|nr:hypothetical protein [Lachnospiraceae bacterium]MCM1232724.1 hypothetical protein [Ruminococcus flavefaciens]
MKRVNKKQIQLLFKNITKGDFYVAYINTKYVLASYDLYVNDNTITLSVYDNRLKCVKFNNTIKISNTYIYQDLTILLNKWLYNSCTKTEMYTLIVDIINKLYETNRDYETEELYLYTINEYSLYNKFESIEKSLLRKLKKDTFDIEKSVNAWRYLAKASAKDYEKRFSLHFKSDTINEVSKMLANDFIVEYM